MLLYYSYLLENVELTELFSKFIIDIVSAIFLFSVAFLYMFLKSGFSFVVSFRISLLTTIQVTARMFPLKVNVLISHYI